MAGGIHPPPEVIASWPKPNYVNPETRGYSVVILTAILGALSVFTVCLRLWTRARVTRNFGVDDWLILFAMFPTVGVAITICLASKVYNFDRHIWDVPIPNGILNTRRIALANEVLYVWGVGFLKISMLFFYKRMSTGIVRKSFVYVLYASIAFVAGFIITFNLTIYLGCRPFNAWWQQVNPYWTHTHTFTCTSDASNLFGAGVVSVLQDFLVAGLPTILFARMDVPGRQKIAMAAVFAVGFFLCLAGILRIVYIHRLFYQTYDTTWYTDEVWGWTAVEVLVGPIVASAPTLKIFVQRHLESMHSRGYWYSTRPSQTGNSGRNLSNRVSHRFSGGPGSFAWRRQNSDMEIGLARGGEEPAVALERVAERPSKEAEIRDSESFQTRQITQRDIDIERRQRRQQALASHPVPPTSPRDRYGSNPNYSNYPIANPAVIQHPPISPVSPMADKHDKRGSTWFSSEYTGSVDESGVSGMTDGKPGFDPDAHALPILTEQDTRDYGFDVGVAQ